MNAKQILKLATKAKLTLYVTLRDDKTPGIGYSDGDLVRPFVGAIKENREELIEILTAELPKIKKRGMPGTIQFDQAKKWLERKKRREQLISPPSAAIWLIGWASPANQRRYQYNAHGEPSGRLHWADWRQAYQEAEAFFNKCVGDADSQFDEMNGPGALQAREERIAKPIDY